MSTQREIDCIAKVCRSIVTKEDSMKLQHHKEAHLGLDVPVCCADVCTEVF